MQSNLLGTFWDTELILNKINKFKRDCDDNVPSKHTERTKCMI